MVFFYHWFTENLQYNILIVDTCHMSCWKQHNSSSLASIVHIWLPKYISLQMKTPTNTFSPPKHLLMTCRTRYMKIQTWFSFVQWLDCTAGSRNKAKEKMYWLFVCWCRYPFSSICRKRLLSWFLLCRRMPQKAQLWEWIRKQTRTSNTRKCVCWYTFFNTSLCKNCVCVLHVHRPLISDLYCMIYV